MLPNPTENAVELERQAAAARASDPARWAAAWAARCAHHPPTIRFDRPSATAPISLTGQACALQCAHCGGHYLRHMRALADPLPEGVRSLLISGGCDCRGRVPVGGQLEAIAPLRPSRRLNWHVGHIDAAELDAIAPQVDVISFDVVGDAETAREVYGLDLTLDDYLATFDMLRARVPTVAHITIGLRAGRLSGERAALAALSERQVESLVFIILIPTPGTAYAECAPPPLDEVANLLLDARLRLPRARLLLGCMRPVGVYRQLADELAVRAGLNGVVNPARAAMRAAEELGLAAEWGDECCAFL